jgi:predicted heme/steroid binding protein
MLGVFSMNDREIFMTLIKNSLSEMQDTIDCLYVSCNTCTKNMLLNRLRKNVAGLSVLVQGLQNNTGSGNGPAAAGPPLNPVRLFTAAELQRYNGKDGNPAYVAVNGTVYDVTNNAAWAAATHFGLTAGRDLTSEFSSCHAGQPILGRLQAVGMLAG